MVLLRAMGGVLLALRDHANDERRGRLFSVESDSVVNFVEMVTKYGINLSTESFGRFSV